MRILVASPLDPAALAELEERHDVVRAFGAPEEELCRLAADREAIVFRSGVSISTAVIAGSPALRLLVRAGSGIDNLDLAEVSRRGILLHRVPGPGAQAVAEMTFGLMLSLARNIQIADRLLRQGRWAKSELAGHNLRAKTLGVVGLGSIGSRVAELGLALGMRVVGCVEHHTEERAISFARREIELAPLEDVVARGDFVTIHVSLTPRTRGLIGRRLLGLMKPTAFLVNIARGGIVDEGALCEALERGHLLGAALDVHENEGDGRVSPLAGLPNVVLTPHLGASTIDAQREIGREVVRFIDSFPGVPIEHEPEPEMAAARARKK